MKKLLWLLVCSVSFGLTANYNDDCVVNFEDFAVFSIKWYEGTNLVSYYKMDDDADNSLVLDTRGYSNADVNQIKTSSISQTGKIDDCFFIAGGPIYCNTTFTSYFKDSFTINVWVKPLDGHPSSRQFFFGADNDSFYHRNYCELFLDTTGRLNGAYCAENKAVIITTDSPVFPDGSTSWTMVTMRVNNVSETLANLKIYVNADGVESGTDTITMADFNISYEYLLGCVSHSGTSQDKYYGYMDSWMLFSEPLSSDEILWLYNTGEGRAGVSEGDFEEDYDIDYYDLAEFAAQWLNYDYTDPCCISVPIAFDSDESVLTYVVNTFTLSAVDDGAPLPLVYEVNDIAENGKMADTFVGTPVLEPNLMPWILRYEGKTVYFITDTVGDSNFMFRAYDGNSYSNYANVQITATANPMDALYFDGEPNAIITIPDNDYLDIMGPQWACSFWINNYLRRPYQTLMSKRNAGPGYEISLKAGKVQFDLYDVNGLVTSVRSDTVISDGQWYCTDIAYAYDDDPNYGYILIYTFNSDAASVSQTASGAFAHSAFSNDANAVIAGNFGFDHLRFWDDVNSSIGHSILHFRDRQDYMETFLAFGNASDVRYKCDEGSGGTITDDKGNAGDGVLGSDVMWHPPYEIFRSLVKH